MLALVDAVCYDLLPIIRPLNSWLDGTRWLTTAQRRERFAVSFILMHTYILLQGLKEEFSAFDMSEKGRGQ